MEHSKKKPRIRHKATNSYKALLKQHADKLDWKRMVDACMKAIVLKEKDVLISFSYLFKFPEDFPKGILMSEGKYEDVYRIKAVKLLNWMHEKGYSQYHYKDVVIHRRNLLRKETDLMLLFKDFLDNEQDAAYTDSSDNEGENIEETG